MQVIVGRIGRPHGIRGDLVVGVRTDEPEARFAIGARLDTDPAGVGPLTVAATRWQSGELIVRFKGIADRTAAGELTGTWLCVDSGALSPLEDPDEFRDADLIDLTVRTVDGEVVGVVADVLHHGQDLLVIRPGADRAGAAGGVAGGGGAAGAGGSGGAGAGGSGGVGAAGPGEATGDLGGAGGRGAAGGPGGVGAAGRGGRGGDGIGAEILVPFVKAIVTEVDLAGATLTIDPPPGLLNPDEAE